MAGSLTVVLVSLDRQPTLDRQRSSLPSLAPPHLFPTTHVGANNTHGWYLTARGGAQALKVLGLSCVAGNTNVDLVTEATLTVVDACDADPDLVVAKGAALPLIEPLHECPQV